MMLRISPLVSRLSSSLFSCCVSDYTAKAGHTQHVDKEGSHEQRDMT